MIEFSSKICAHHSNFSQYLWDRGGGILRREGVVLPLLAPSTPQRWVISTMEPFLFLQDTAVFSKFIHHYLFSPLLASGIRDKADKTTSGNESEDPLVLR